MGKDQSLSLGCDEAGGSGGWHLRYAGLAATRASRLKPRIVVFGSGSSLGIIRP